MGKKPSNNYGGIGSDAVKAKTGKGWNEWIRLLDKDKAYKLSHKEIALHLSEKYGVGDWWCQMVTVGYEQAKGLREVYQTTSGFSASISKTFNVPIATLYDWWEDNKKRKKWLKENITIHKATKNKGMRITMSDGSKAVSVNFYSKGEMKTQATVQQEKLKDAKAVAASKGMWKKAFDNLQKSLEV
jgi:uncharacterized protein YndB with AHSA1/START domain